MTPAPTTSKAREPETRYGGGGQSTPVSVALAMDLRRAIAAEAKRRGLKLSTALRVLAAERLEELREAEELSRAHQWQRAEAWATWQQVAAGGVAAARREATVTDLDAVFDAAARPGKVAKPRRRRK